MNGLIRTTLIALAVSTALGSAHAGDVFFRGSGYVFDQSAPVPAPGLQTRTIDAPVAVDPTPTPAPVPTPTTPLALALSGALVSGGTIAYGADWSTTFQPSGGKAPYSIALDKALPAGVTAGGSPASLSGRTKDGSYGPFTATVTDAAGATAKATIPAFQVAVAADPFRVVAPATLTFPKGAPWSIAYTGAGGLAPYDVDAVFGGRGDGTPGRFTFAGPEGRDAVGSTARGTNVVVQVGGDAVLTASAVNGLDVTPTTATERTLTITNVGDNATLSKPTVAVSSPFQVVSSSCTGAGVLDGQGGHCEVVLKGAAGANGALSGTATVSGIGTPITLTGTASGFSACSSPGDNCGDGTYFLGLNGSTRTYGQFPNINTAKTYTWNDAVAACQSLGTGWSIWSPGYAEPYVTAMEKHLRAAGWIGAPIWTKQSAASGQAWYSSITYSSGTRAFGGGTSARTTLYPAYCVKGI